MKRKIQHIYLTWHIHRIYYLPHLANYIFNILTESFNSTNSKNTFNYNILYRISENQWWNVLLIMISFMLSVVVFISLVSYKKKAI